jgi:signal transduction histidine kinase
MRERAEKLQGQLTIQSIPGKGTNIQLTVPIAEESNNKTSPAL